MRESLTSGREDLHDGSILLKYASDKFAIVAGPALSDMVAIKLEYCMRTLHTYLANRQASLGPLLGFKAFQCPSIKGYRCSDPFIMLKKGSSLVND